MIERLDLFSCLVCDQECDGQTVHIDTPIRRLHRSTVTSPRLECQSPVYTTRVLCARPVFMVYVFTTLHVMQTRYSDEDSVCLSVTRVYCDKTEERSVQIFVPYER